MESLDFSAVAIASAGAIAAGAYANAKFSIGADLLYLRGGLQWRKQFMSRLQQLGDTCSLYGLFDLVDTSLDLLWFEGRTWTYGELKQGTSPQFVILYRDVDLSSCVM